MAVEIKNGSAKSPRRLSPSARDLVAERSSPLFAYCSTWQRAPKHLRCSPSALSAVYPVKQAGKTIPALLTKRVSNQDANYFNLGHA